MQQCFTATVNCPSAADPLTFIYGYWSPQGTPTGTIVTLTGDGGTYASTPAFSDFYIPEYEAANYQVVEVAWGAATPGTAWEIANSGNNSTTTPTILNAACRVATFLHYVKTTLWTANGMCVHADSGGAGGLGYALTWYGEASDLNKVLMENGPVFSRIDLGCDVPNGNTTTVCAPNTPQTGCNGPTWPLGSNGQPISYSLEYISQDSGNVNLWSGNTGPACANGQGDTTNYNQSWYGMSVLSGNQPVHQNFNYPATKMSAWLCQSASSGGMNNSAAQGQEYFVNLTQQSQAGGQMSLNGVVCSGIEGIELGTTTYNGENYNGTTCFMLNGRQVCNNAWEALVDDMINTSGRACNPNF